MRHQQWGEASESGAAYGPVTHQNTPPFASRDDKLCAGQCSITICMLWPQTSTELPRAFCSSKSPWDQQHCSWWEALTSLWAAWGPSLDRHLWQQRWEQSLPCCKPACSQCWLRGALALPASCQQPRAGRFSKVTQSNASLSQMFLLMWCFVVKLFQENSSFFFSENVSTLKAEPTFKAHQYKVINWSNSSGIDCPRKPLWCACIDAPLQNKWLVVQIPVCADA